jgi:hypothetical protein
MFLQGVGALERYILDRLPPWVEAMLGQARATLVDVRYIPGANLDMFHQEVRAAVYQDLVAGGYKVRQAGSGKAYVPVAEVFCA